MRPLGARKVGLPRVTRGSPDTSGSPPRALAAVPKVLQVREMLQMSRRWFSVHPVRHLVACLKVVLRLCCAGGAADETGDGLRAFVRGIDVVAERQGLARSRPLAGLCAFALPC